jgi:hypothetical protein
MKIGVHGCTQVQFCLPTCFSSDGVVSFAAHLFLLRHSRIVRARTRCLFLQLHVYNCSLSFFNKPVNSVAVRIRRDTGILHFLSLQIPCFVRRLHKQFIKMEHEKTVNFETAIQMFKAKPGRFAPVMWRHAVLKRAEVYLSFYPRISKDCSDQLHSCGARGRYRCGDDGK